MHDTKVRFAFFNNRHLPVHSARTNKPLGILQVKRNKPARCFFDKFCLNLTKLSSPNFTNMKPIKTTFLWLVTLLLLAGCNSKFQTSVTVVPDNPETQSQNNLLITHSENNEQSPSTGTTYIFEGSNNIIEIILKNNYLDSGHDVVIVKGNNMNLRFIRINTTLLKPTQLDTLIIVGDNQKYILDNSFSFPLDTLGKDLKTVTVNLPEESMVKKYEDVFARENLKDAKLKIRTSYFEQPVTIEYAYNYFLEKLSTGDPEYFYQMGEFFLYGIGVEQSLIKAVELYEFAAMKNHIPALTKLGLIYSGNFESKPNLAKARFYLKLCASLGEDFCKEQLKILPPR